MGEAKNFDAKAQRREGQAEARNAGCVPGGVLLVIMALCLMAMAGCDRTKEAAGGPNSSFAWNAQLNGSGKDVTGGGFSVSQANSYQPVEQLEKGNGAKVAAQLKANAILPPVPTKTPAAVAVCPGGTCETVYVPYAEATQIRSSEPAWYNGFIP